MFDKNYKSAMDNISPSAEAKDKILNKIEQKENSKKQKSLALPWRIAFACVACVAIILGVLFVPKSINPTVKVEKDKKVLSVAQNYSEIYKVFRNKKIMARFNNFGLYKNEVAYEYATDDSAALGAGNTNGTADGVTAAEGSASKGDYSGTTEQVEGVSEADIVKTDGNYIYYLKQNYNREQEKLQKSVNIFSALGEKSKLIGSIDFYDGNNYGDSDEMFLKDNRLIILQKDYCQPTDDMAGPEENYVNILIYDISDPANPKKIASNCQQGYYNSARMVGDYIYLISNCNIDVARIEKNNPSTFVPSITCDGKTKTVSADCIYHYNNEIDNPSYAVVGAYSYKDGALCNTASILGGGGQIYCSTDNIILTKATYHDVGELSQNGARVTAQSTVVSRLEIKDGKITYKASGEIDGELENQFFIDQHRGYFRFVTTVTDTAVTTTKFADTTQEIETYDSVTSARLTILDSNLKKVGEIKNLAPDERVYSVRFMGDIAYFVTFRQVDPLFSADLSDPANPKIIGELKIPGFSEYMYPYGEGKLLGFGQDADPNSGRTSGLKLSMFDISDPANVIENNKTIISNMDFSPALYNHKAMLVSNTKNLIGFATENNNGPAYLVYQYTDSGFVLKATLSAASNNQHIDYDSRGLFVNENFYLVANGILKVYDIKTFSQIKVIDF
ncbi:MAG: beta-propeller domain-containing protein [Clostridia bacterium]|nr:beta-propeller domain-containing protein [Clostridia bacterium]